MWPTKWNWLQRWIARKTAARILNDESAGYQFGGPIGAKCPDSYEMVVARKEQLAHWILRTVGYNCCPADLMELTGYGSEPRKNL